MGGAAPSGQMFNLIFPRLTLHFSTARNVHIKISLVRTPALGRLSPSFDARPSAFWRNEAQHPQAIRATSPQPRRATHSTRRGSHSTLRPYPLCGPEDTYTLWSIFAGIESSPLALQHVVMYTPRLALELLVCTGTQACHSPEKPKIVGEKVFQHDVVPAPLVVLRRPTPQPLYSVFPVLRPCFLAVYCPGLKPPVPTRVLPTTRTHIFSPLPPPSITTNPSLCSVEKMYFFLEKLLEKKSPRSEQEANGTVDQKSFAATTSTKVHDRRTRKPCYNKEPTSYVRPFQPPPYQTVQCCFCRSSRTSI